MSRKSAAANGMGETVARNLRAAMKGQRVTQLELAERSGIGQSTISRILRNEVGPAAATLEPLARALGVSLADLLNDLSAPNVSPRSEIEGAGALKVSRLVELYSACEERNQKLLLELAEQLASKKGRA